MNNMKKDVWIYFGKRGYAKSLFERNRNWRELKRQIKSILDERDSCICTKIYSIEALLDNYKNRYLNK